MGRWKQGDGFTLIEVVIVSTIIGILAAIAIPLYLSQQGRAQNSIAVTARNGAMEFLQGKYMLEGDKFPEAANVICGEELGTKDTSYKWKQPSTGCSECTHEAQCSSLGESEGNSEVGLEISLDRQVAEVCVKNTPGSGEYYCAYQNNRSKEENEKEGGEGNPGSKFCKVKANNTPTLGICDGSE